MDLRRAAACLFAAIALAAPSHRAQAAEPVEPGFVVARPYVRDHLETLLSAQRAAGVAPSARPGVPTPCNATDSGDSVRYTWTAVPGAKGYYVYVDGAIRGALDSTVTSFEDQPGVGTHSYCVAAFNHDGVSDPCCDTGAQTGLSTPHCALSVSSGAPLFQWSHIAGANGYNVYRDGTLLATFDANTLAYYDTTKTGDHTYCVEAFATGVETSGRCCQIFHGAPPPPGSVGPCSASSDRVGQILVTWTDVSTETGYLVKEDGVVLTTLPADTTHLLVSNIFGFHEFCVHGINASGGGPDCCADGIGLTASERGRLSWGTCDPQVPNQNFSGPGVYTLVLSVQGAATVNEGHDSELRIHPAVPEAWRFDDAGCQTETRLNLQNAGVNGSCPAMLGNNPLSITSYYLDVDGSAALRLAVTYDDLATVAGQRYVLWQIGFDHSHSIAGTDADPATCDGAAVGLNFTVTPQILQTNGIALAASMEPGDQPVTWNGGQASNRTRVQPTTWGRLKGLYR
jgi:hypothetical protein